jgi:hypothetical protein
VNLQIAVSLGFVKKKALVKTRMEDLKDPELEGWLEVMKRADKMRKWKKRYCQLKDTVLYILSDFDVSLVTFFFHSIFSSYVVVAHAFFFPFLF